MGKGSIRGESRGEINRLQYFKDIVVQGMHHNVVARREKSLYFGFESRRQHEEEREKKERL